MLLVCWPLTVCLFFTFFFTLPLQWPFFYLSVLFVGDWAVDAGASVPEREIHLQNNTSFTLTLVKTVEPRLLVATWGCVRGGDSVVQGTLELYLRSQLATNSRLQRTAWRGKLQGGNSAPSLLKVSGALRMWRSISPRQCKLFNSQGKIIIKKVSESFR